MISKVKNMTSLGAINEELALYYNDETEIFYSGKIAGKYKNMQMRLSGAQIIVLVATVNLLDRVLKLSGILPLLIGMLLAFLGALLSFQFLDNAEFELEIYQFKTDDDLLLFLEERNKRYKQGICFLILLTISIILISFLYLITNRFLWFFTAVGLIWAEISFILIFVKYLPRFKKVYRCFKEKLWKRYYLLEVLFNYIMQK